MNLCALCSIKLPNQPIIDGSNSFCCNGCHAVFNILSSKQQLDNYQQHPLFLQALRSGIISNPALLEEAKRHQPDLTNEPSEKLYLEVGEMWCPSCSEIIRLMLLKEKGIRHCVVDYATDLASIEFSPRYVSKEKIYSIIKNLGYRADPLQSPEKRKVSLSLYLRFIVAAFCSLNIMMFAYPLYATYFDYDSEGYGNLFAWLSFLAILPVIFYSAWPIFRRFITSLKVGIFGMETLVVIGICAAFAISAYDLWMGGTKVYFDSLSVIIVFVLLGKIIETKAKFSAKDAMIQLSRASPRRGRKRLPDGSSQFVLIKEINPGDILIVMAGEKIILDGIIVEGEGSCDESLMTGESIPVMKKISDPVLGGTILQQGWLAIRVTATFEESALKKIIEMVEKDIGNKTVYVRAADTIVNWFVPLVITIATTTALICLAFKISDPGHSIMETAILRAIAVLLISCPCAIGIAAPLAESHLLNALAALGAIVRNRGCLPYLAKKSVFVFDKTGTITQGQFNVLKGIDSLSKEEKGHLKGLCLYSNHPISVATAKSISEEPIPFEHIEEIIGRGLKGILQSDIYYFGSAVFFKEQGIFIEENEEKNNKQAVTHVYFGKNKHCLAQLTLGDKVRDGVKETLDSLKPSKSWLVSGDSQQAVEYVGKTCRFDKWYWGCHPLQKREIIEQLRQEGEVVCMLGDGINDAPALTASHVGISVFSATDMSIQVSDILLTTDKLNVISKIRELAKKGQKIINQNLFWAFFYNVVGIGLAAFGVLSPIFAAFAMAASSLMVLFNAKRIK